MSIVRPRWKSGIRFCLIMSAVTAFEAHWRLAGAWLCTAARIVLVRFA